MSVLKDLRKEHKFTQEELAKKAGVATTTISSYETGHRKIPVPIAIKLGIIFNINWTIFFNQEVLESYDYEN